MKSIMKILWFIIKLPFRILALLEPGGIDHPESSRNNQSKFIRNSQCTYLTNRFSTVIQQDR